MFLHSFPASLQQIPSSYFLFPSKAIKNLREAKLNNTSASTYLIIPSSHTNSYPPHFSTHPSHQKKTPLWGLKADKVEAGKLTVAIKHRYHFSSELQRSLVWRSRSCHGLMRWIPLPPWSLTTSFFPWKVTGPTQKKESSVYQPLTIIFSGANC